jgi:hypothetical protein
MHTSNLTAVIGTHMVHPTGSRAPSRGLRLDFLSVCQGPLAHQARLRDNRFLEDNPAASELMTMCMQVLVDWDDAPMRDFANCVFKLNGRVDDPELLMQARPHVLENSFAY